MDDELLRQPCHYSPLPTATFAIAVATITLLNSTMSWPIIPKLSIPGSSVALFSSLAKLTKTRRHHAAASLLGVWCLHRRLWRACLRAYLCFQPKALPRKLFKSCQTALRRSLQQCIALEQIYLSMTCKQMHFRCVYQSLGTCTVSFATQTFKTADRYLRCCAFAAESAHCLSCSACCACSPANQSIVSTFKSSTCRFRAAQVPWSFSRSQICSGQDSAIAPSAVLWWW